MMKDRKIKKKATDAARKLQGIVTTVLRRFKGVRGELGTEEKQPAPDLDPVTEAGQESFPASDPPSFTPEKST